MKRNRKWSAGLAALALVMGGMGVSRAADEPDFTAKNQTFSTAQTIDGEWVWAENCTANGALTVTNGGELSMLGGAINGGLTVKNGSEMIGKGVTIASNLTAEETQSSGYSANGYIAFIDSTMTKGNITATGSYTTEFYSGVEFVGSTVNVSSISAKDSSVSGKLGGIVAFGLGSTVTADTVSVGSHSAVAAGDFNFKEALASLSEYIGTYTPNGKTTTITVKNVQLGKATTDYEMDTPILTAMKDGMLGGVLGAGDGGKVIVKDGAVTGNGTILSIGGTIEIENAQIAANVAAVDPANYGDSDAGTNKGTTSTISLKNTKGTSTVFGVGGETSTISLSGSEISAEELYVLDGGTLNLKDKSTLTAKGAYIGPKSGLSEISFYSDDTTAETVNVEAGSTLIIGEDGAIVGDGGVLNIKSEGTLKAQNGLEIRSGGTLNLAAKSSTYALADDSNAVKTGITAQAGAMVSVDPAAQLFVENAKADGSEYTFTNVIAGSDAKFRTVYGSTVLTKLQDDGKTFATSDVASALPEAEAPNASTAALLAGSGAAYDFVNKALGKDAGDISLSDRASHLNQLAGLTSLGGALQGTYGFAGTMSDLVENHEGKHRDIWASYIREDKTVDGFKAGNETVDYDLKYNGFILGGEFAKTENSYTGAAFAFADGDAASNGGLVSTRNDLKYYGLSVYHVRNAGGMTYKADIGYTWGDNDLTQYNLGTKITGSADTSAFHIGLRAEKEIEAGGSVWTPYAGLRYILADADDYTDSLGFKHSSDRAGVWNLPVGIRFAHETQSGSWTVKPLAEIGYIFAFGDKDVKESLSYNGAYDSFRSDLAENRFTCRLGVSASKNNMSYALRYGYEKGSDVKTNRWGVEVSYSF